MKRTTFMIAGVVSLIVVLSGFVATYYHQTLLSIGLIAAGGLAFYVVSKQAKKEDWFGKPAK